MDCLLMQIFSSNKNTTYQLSFLITLHFRAFVIQFKSLTTHRNESHTWIHAYISRKHMLVQYLGFTLMYP